MKKYYNFLFTIFYLLKNFRMPFGYKTFVQVFEDAIISDMLIQKIRPYTMIPMIRLLSLYMQVKHCERHHIKGDYMECGVWKGGAVGLMALTNQMFGDKRRHLHLFDAFDDICVPDIAVDGKKAIEDVFHYTDVKNVETLQKIPKNKPLKGFYSELGGKGTLVQNKKLLLSEIKYDKQYVHFYKGWFESTIPKLANDIHDIAILRIDADWYTSVDICLRYFYPKVVKGGFIVIDDYGYYEGCTKAVDDYFRKFHIHKKPIKIDSGCAYFVK